MSMEDKYSELSGEERLNILLRYQNKLDDINYRLSHDLRGPLASIIGLLKVADRTSLSDENKMIFDWIEKKTIAMEAEIQILSKALNAFSKHE